MRYQSRNARSFEQLESRFALTVTGVFADVTTQLADLEMQGTRISVGSVELEGQLLLKVQSGLPGDHVLLSLDPDNKQVDFIWREQIANSRFQTTDDLAVIDDVAYFLAADDAIPNPDRFPDFKLWRTDGTSIGTWPTEVSLLLDASVPKRLFATSAGGLFITTNIASPVDASSELWHSDLSQAGTSKLAEFYIGEYGQNALSNFVELDGKWLFGASDIQPRSLDQYGLFNIDPATQRLQHIERLSDDSHSHPRKTLVGANELTRIGDTVYLSGGNWWEHGTELWRTEGTSDETHMVMDIHPGDVPYQSSSRPSQLTNVNGTLFFNADDGEHGRELWQSDGTAAGTRLVTEVVPGEAGFISTDARAVGELYFFDVDSSAFYHPQFSASLWRSDGTTSGTFELQTHEFSPEGMIEFNGRLFYYVDTDSHFEVWTSDGTVNGTQLAVSVPSEGRFVGSALIPFGDRIVFAVVESENDVKLWDVEPSRAVLEGDINGDRKVDVHDFLILSRNFGRADVEDLSDGDLNEDGLVDVRDFLVLSRDFGRLL